MIPMTEMATCIRHQQILVVFMSLVQMGASCFNPLLLLHLKLDAQFHLGITWCPLPYLHIFTLASLKLWFMFSPWNLRNYPVLLTIWATLSCDPGLPHDCIEYSNQILQSPTKHKQDKVWFSIMKTVWHAWDQAGELLCQLSSPRIPEPI